MAQLLYGAPVADAMDARSVQTVESLRASGVSPCLAILRVGDQPDQLSYEKGALKRCNKVGVEARVVRLEQDVSQDGLMRSIAALNADDGVHGILMLAPLPSGLDERAARNAIAASKDVDAAGDASLQGVFLGDEGAFAPCTAQACIEVLDHYQVPIEGKRVVVVGRSLVIGKPVSMLLLSRNATVTICHSRTADLPGTAREADILVVAIGRERSIGIDCVSPGQTVIDVGINYNEQEGRLYGDVDTDAVAGTVAAITPVPRGIGSITTSVLVSHVITSAARMQCR